MSHAVKRSNSQYQQFRMVVPHDIQHIIGRSAWTKSLGTTDSSVVKVELRELIARYSNEVLYARGKLTRPPWTLRLVCSTKSSIDLRSGRDRWTRQSLNSGTV